MRTTLVVTLEDDLQEFMARQGTIDPSGLVTMLIRRDMEKQGFQPSSQVLRAQESAQQEELELLLDQSTPAAD